MKQIMWCCVHPISNKKLLETLAILENTSRKLYKEFSFLYTLEPKCIEVEVIINELKSQEMTYKDEPIISAQNWGNYPSHGLTKLGYFSAMAMQGLLTLGLDNFKDNSYAAVAADAVNAAKALIEQLNKEENNDKEKA